MKTKYVIKKIKDGVFFVMLSDGDGYPIASETTQRKAELVVKKLRKKEKKANKDEC